ncbi:hypothetical protein RZS08_16785, partial [Arthrospira platensis SPKY1]|nr:hypothetical protein [Arthrospira platensis SPKY1]
YDILQILDANDTVIQSFFENTHLTDVWSDYVPGRIVKVRLLTNGVFEDWGFRVDAIVDSVSNPGLAQSHHPYPPNLTQEWTVVNPNVSAMSSKIHFSRINISRYDILQILDANDTVIQSFFENTHLTDVWSDYVPGRIVKVRLLTNGVFEDWGFRVDAIVDSVSNPGLAQSHHPYPPNLTQEWTVVNPNVSAMSSKIHFSRINISRYL